MDNIEKVLDLSEIQMRKNFKESETFEYSMFGVAYKIDRALIDPFLDKRMALFRSYISEEFLPDKKDEYALFAGVMEHLQNLGTSIAAQRSNKRTGGRTSVVTTSHNEDGEFESEHEEVQLLTKRKRSKVLISLYNNVIAMDLTMKKRLPLVPLVVGMMTQPATMMARNWRKIMCRNIRDQIRV